jgi:hypothetical protein
MPHGWQPFRNLPKTAENWHLAHLSEQKMDSWPLHRRSLLGTRRFQRLGGIFNPSRNYVFEIVKKQEV